MQIPPVLTKCVVFLGCKKKLVRDAETIEPRGTAFFASYPIPGAGDENAKALYVVTAAHVIEEIEKRSLDGAVQIRCNVRDGGAQWVSVPVSNWTIATDPHIDVAIAPFRASLWLDHLFVPFSMLCTSNTIEEENILDGHDLFFPGLFVHHFGKERNLPIMRTGTLAAIPQERIATRKRNIRGYLAEARSIGGLSGSPVFVQTGPFRQLDDGTLELSLDKQVNYFLLGLVHGHFGDRDILDNADAVPHDALSRSLNMGIAIVVSSDSILEVFEQPNFVEQRKQLADEIIAARTRHLPEVD